MLKFLAGCCILLAATAFNAGAQDTLHRSPSDTVSIVTQVHSDRLRLIKVDSVTQLQMFAGKVILQQNNTTFYCDSAVINKHSNILEAFGHVHINDADSIHIYSEYLIYHIDTKVAVLKKKVKLTDSKGILTTEELQYDTKAKTGVYTTGGKIVNGTTIITSKEATYYGDLKDVYFKKDVKLRDPKTDLDTDSLLYNTETQLATFITKTVIKDSSGATITTKEGSYDMHTKKSSFGKRAIINDGKGVTVTGDDIFNDDATGQTTINGNAVYVDTVQKISVLANHFFVDKNKKTFLATQHPLMIMQQDNDSVYVTADTMFSARIADIRDSAYTELHNDTSTAKIDLPPAKGDLDNPVKPGIKKPGNMRGSDVKNQPPPSAALNKDNLKNSSIGAAKDSTDKIVIAAIKKDSGNAFFRTDTMKGTVIISGKDSSDARYFQCFHHVRIFSDSMQAVCDSLFYSAKDSVFRLFTEPILWASGSQVTGYTIYLFTKNNKAERLYAFENGFAINLSGERMYNQISGKTLNGYFRDGAIDYLRTKGSPAQSIYYAKDEDNAVVGVNNVSGDYIDMRFENKELKKVVVIRDVSGTMYPFRQTPEEKKLLRNFKWLDEKRPKTKFALFEN